MVKRHKMYTQQIAERTINLILWKSHSHLDVLATNNHAINTISSLHFYTKRKH